MSGPQKIPLRLKVSSSVDCTRDPQQPLYEFHILADVRKKYEFDESLYTISGNVIFPNFHSVRKFAKKLNDHRDLGRHPERAVKAGHLNAMGLIDEINHFMLRRYEETENPGVIMRAMTRLGGSVGEDRLQEMLKTFGEQFPPIDVHNGKYSFEEYLSQYAGRKSYREVTLEEIILLWLANINPAFSPFKELFNDQHLLERTPYRTALDELGIYFSSEKAAGPEGVSILELLRAPMLASPHSLEGQLSYIRKHWGVMLSKEVLSKMTGAGDLIREETKLIIPAAQQETVVPRYTRISPFGEIDEERFTADIDWMPNVVLLAKNIYVWLDQLSKKYSRAVTTLDHIPDEELDQLARWNINALWMIGIWERSKASQTIKQIMGNPEAVASAYSVYDYEIARDLGGELAFQNLRSRAWQRGIRLAGDMVPNHVGIFAKWVIEHPEYFIQSAYSPFPNYSFTGVNLSDSAGVELRIEDGYWTRRDAAVVFQRIDRATGDVRYIYHGNDGTHTPWNDTAQLDFLKSEVREAVVQMIFHVAKKFPVIRFDAAMVLTKQHFQRLWYPQPGSGGDIPSRADHALAKDAFDRAFPVEFWRDVVDRINREIPDTLLLAEAFWLLEGYFVRTLGMHRVYNSAFMHMMMKEENAKYRELIRNTLAFNPEILKRYVNFMSNPDERTAVDQFGKDDKYFGTAMMMVTMPGLPMFAHGQIEGFNEKYGMEYKRAYYEELPDEHLVERHRREIFPVLKKRYLFSQVTNFELYDVLDAHGNILENIFCFSNRAGDERALFCYNNRYESCTGTVAGTVPKVQMDGTTASGRKPGVALGLCNDERFFYVLREHNAGIEFLRTGKDLCERGMALNLQGFQYQLFREFREIYDESGEYAQLAAALEGRGVPDVGVALNEMRLAPVHRAFRSITALASIYWSGSQTAQKIATVPGPLLISYRDFLREAGTYYGKKVEADRWVQVFEEDMKSVKNSVLFSGLTPEKMIDGNTERNVLSIYFVCLICRRLDAVFDKRNTVGDLQLSIVAGQEVLDLFDMFISYPRVLMDVCKRGLSEFIRLLDDVRVQNFLNTHAYEGISYFSKERFGDLLDVLLIGTLHEIEYDGKKVQKPVVEPLRNISTLLKAAAERSGYRWQEFRQAIASTAVESSQENSLK